MANLLDEASILLTATAYNNGRMLAVKPEIALGEDLAYNWDFTSGWNTFGGGTSVTNSTTFISESGQGIYTGLGLVAGKKYKILISGTQPSGGYLSIKAGTTGTSFGNITEQSFDKIIYVTPSTVTGVGNSFYIRLASHAVNTSINITKLQIQEDLSGDFTFSRNSAATRVNAQGLVENVQILSSNLVSNGDFSQEGVQEVSNGSFTNGTTDWSLTSSGDSSSNVIITNGSCQIISDGTLTGLTQTLVTTIGKTYKCTINISSVNNIGGGIAISNGNVFASSIATFTTAEIHTFYFKATSTSVSIKRASGLGGSIDYTIDNISVKEVGQDWTLGTGWSIGENKAISDGSGFGALSSSYSNFNSKKLKVNFDILNYVSGEIRVPPSYRQDGLDIRYSANGSYELIYDSINSAFALNTVNFNGSITNISVIEITDDTNLPRINYEGFSYQDSLGSEEIVNGDFSNGSANWNYTTSWEISDGKANFTNISSKGMYQAKVLDANKTYKVSFDYNGTGQVGFLGTAGGGNTLKGFANYSNGNNVIYITPTTTTSAFNIWGNWSGAFSIDNVSVKEVLGQEVVPNSGCGSWLLEPQSTNLIPYSEDFSNASWQKVASSTVTTNTVISPDGTLNADTYKASSSSYGCILRAITTFDFVSPYTVSFYVKKNNYRYVGLRLGNLIGASDSYNFFDFDTETVNNTPAPSAELSFEKLTNGWYKLSLTGTPTSSTLADLALTQSNGSTINPIGTEEVYVYGAQLEQNSYATSYIPTQGGAISTRLADIATNSGNASLINSEEGVLYFEGSAFDDNATNSQITISDGTSNNRVYFNYNLSSNILFAIVKSVNGTTVFAKSTAVNFNVFNKLALKYKQNDFSFWLNGVKIGSDTSGNSPIGLNKLNFSSPGTALPFYGKTKALAVYKTALTDAQLTLLTTI